MSDKSGSNPFMDMFQQFGRNLQLPTAQVSDVVEHHKRNIEALQKAARITTEGTQSLMAKQRETLEETLADIATMVQDASASKDPGKIVSDQVEFAKRSFETTIKNTTELGETIRGSGTEVFTVLKDRVEESIGEIRDSMAKKD